MFRITGCRFCIRLPEKGKDPLRRKRSAKDIPDKLGVLGPVGAKLKLHGDTGGHPHHEGDGKELEPEAGRLVVFLPAGPPVTELEHSDDGRQPDGERRVKKVEESGQAKLEPG